MNAAINYMSVNNLWFASSYLEYYLKPLFFAQMFNFFSFLGYA